MQTPISPALPQTPISPASQATARSAKRRVDDSCSTGEGGHTRLVCMATPCRAHAFLPRLHAPHSVVALRLTRIVLCVRYRDGGPLAATREKILQQSFGASASEALG